ncbi:MAG TPA: plasmid pRiA4b ORF-3 family protein [Candidatus Saccharimonadia bacterium]|nr:plasmid pRiA4b ORF-3 family protein [Candidatus Saccharimonadia bacterium]
MPRVKPSSDLSVYQLKVTLRDSKPPIWRRIQVTSDIRLSTLHRVLQGVMGWEDAHLHQFMAHGIYYGTPHPDFGFEVQNEQQVSLQQVMSRAKDKLIYEYDFGDSWKHELLVEKILPLAEGKRYPVCLTGKRACPPEDCGGIWGYASLLEAIRDPEHPEHEERVEWVGSEFDPDIFDLDEINRELQRLTSPVGRRQG